MKKSLTRKTWFTLSEAANYLTKNNEDESEVTVSDILQYAMDREITLSIRTTRYSVDCFPTARIEPITTTYLKQDHSVEQWQRNAFKIPVTGFSVGGETYVKIDSEPDYLEIGIWDIAFSAMDNGVFGQLWSYSKFCGLLQVDNLENAAEILEEKDVLPLLLVSPYRSYAVRVPIHEVPNGAYLGVRLGQLMNLLSEEENDQNEPHSLKPVLDDFRVLYEVLEAEELPHVDILIAAWRYFWKGRRPDDGRGFPINREVATWIRSRMEKPSATMADHMASIIRPIWAPAGRQPTRNQ